MGKETYTAEVSYAYTYTIPTSAEMIREQYYD